MNKFTKNSKNQEGITLVALVITVVVMLILAGVAIAAIVDGNGLFNRTRQATESYENAARNEADKIKTLMNEIDNYLGNVDDEDDEDNNPPAGGGIIANPINKVVNVNQTYDGQTTGTYNNPIIPKGFAPVNEGNAVWGSADGYQKGLVITDAVTGTESTGNEFVWVPVDGTNVKFGRQTWYKSDGTTAFGKKAEECEETIPAEISTSVTNNGGFYIARFEAGKPETGNLATDGTVKPVSKQGATVWNNIKWSESGTNDDTTPGNGAVTVARSMYSVGDANYGAVSTLIYGAQWDTALRFIGAYGGDAGYATDSTGKGNYSGKNGADDIASTSALAECGARDGFRQKNIYDMAGNVREWTMEKYGSTSRINRGGDFDDSGSACPASSRNYDAVHFAHSGIGFRVGLYIKQL